MNQPPRLLLIEDDPGLSLQLERILTAEGYRVCLETRGDTGWQRNQAETFDVVLTDFKLPHLSGLELVDRIHEARPRTPVILMTAHGTAETAIEATKRGAYDYLLKPFEMESLLELLDKAVTSSRRMSEPVSLGTGRGDALIGNSLCMQRIYKDIGRVAPLLVPVLIRGETGTGKELVTRAIYQHSLRAAMPFVAINCAAIPETLLESELFGHERGAFTGAEMRRIGRFEQADGGTLFLDEIGDLSPGTQAKLLRVLQEGTIQRLGAKETLSIDVRVIAATHQNLEELQRQGRFRADLYYRLNVVVLSLPPLRERTEDIRGLLSYFLARHGPALGVTAPSMTSEAIVRLQSHSWPGNVRQLENVVRKLLIQSRGFAIDLESVEGELAAPTLAESSSEPLSSRVSSLLAAAQRGERAEVHRHLMTQVEEELFRQAISLAQGNQAKAARWLGISRLTMREKLLQFGLHPLG